ncbi:hypothetical protein B0J13DRAFT_641274 [Dactylonectria estremocensis]|uniref:Histone acetyltransferase n=1 Tax=Dactylonectria estremocensis TaxID=1079267 RepID=A0A9P9ECK0_9HYPO|nr:hypothetical protein B0J13DRAFT_641274 [Dactylonectria estremocensis]
MGKARGKLARAFAWLAHQGFLAGGPMGGAGGGDGRVGEKGGGGNRETAPTPPDRDQGRRLGIAFTVIFQAVPGAEWPPIGAYMGPQGRATGQDYRGRLPGPIHKDGLPSLARWWSGLAQAWPRPWEDSVDWPLDPLKAPRGSAISHCTPSGLDVMDATRQP